MEASGPSDEVMKVMSALTITDDELTGLAIIAESVRATVPESDGLLTKPG